MRFLSGIIKGLLTMWYELVEAWRWQKKQDEIHKRIQERIQRLEQRKEKHLTLIQRHMDLETNYNNRRHNLELWADRQRTNLREEAIEEGFIKPDEGLDALYN